ncbi:serine protease 3-like [Drosophila obscura]|uniref:serine protease 3-like n=1 Tax=Drosophila obscura TaxID=7282 RepID=UPI000BA0BB98|nr:serine protease 3-like [Drosophila obscura]
MLILLCLLVAQLFIVGESNQLQRIVNGELAEEGQFPYLVGVVMEQFLHPIIKSKLCGGSIISNEWILTAAHCVPLLKKKVYIFYGSTQFKTAEVKEVSATNIHRHPKYRIILNDKFRYDIALIQTPRVKFNNYIQSIPLPSPRDDRRSTKPGQSVISAGWGSSVLGGESVDRLNWVELEIVDESVCERKYGGNLERILCVSTHEKKSICSGDSGGPLVPKDENKLIGIVSFGSTLGCDVGQPVVYTNVITYLDWIESVSGVKP